MKDFLERNCKQGHKHHAVVDLYTRLAGDKLAEVNKAAESFMSQGKKFERALADALESFKLV